MPHLSPAPASEQPPARLGKERASAGPTTLSLLVRRALA